MSQIIIDTRELFQLISYAAQKGYTGEVELCLDDDEINLDKLKAVIDNAVLMQKSREKALERSDEANLKSTEGCCRKTDKDIELYLLNHGVVSVDG